jgi:hypothetical protein
MYILCLNNESKWSITIGAEYNVLKTRHLAPAGVNPKLPPLLRKEYLIMDDSKETHWYWSKLFRELTKEEIREYKIEQVLIGLH